MLLQVIVASTRPGRKGKAVADWFMEQAAKHGRFELDLIDLAEVNLPFLDEPNHPRLGAYTQEHTRRWSQRIQKGDAYVLVTAEYNYGYPAPLKNALDYLYTEWNNKPVGFVSYGGLAAGTRSVQQLKQVTQSLQMIAVPDQVAIPFIAQKVDETGVFINDEKLEASAATMLDQLYEWAERLKPMRLS